MRVDNGTIRIDLRRRAKQVEVRLTGDQIDIDCLDVITRYVSLSPANSEQYVARVTCPLPAEATSLADLTDQAHSPLEKLELADRVLSLETLFGKFTIPFLHPDNVYLAGTGVEVAYSGLQGILAPRELDSTTFFRQARALVLSIFLPNTNFDQLVEAASAVKGELTSRIGACQSFPELKQLLRLRLAEESPQHLGAKTTFSRARLIITTAGAITAALLSLTLAWFVYRAYAGTIPRQAAIIASQSDFMAGAYDKTVSDLSRYPLTDLPRQSRYSLAVSSVNLLSADGKTLSAADQKAALNSLAAAFDDANKDGTVADDQRIDYWAALGRHDFNQADDLALRLGDKHLSRIAYTLQKETVEADTDMEGTVKEKTLDELQTKLDTLSRMDADSKKASQEQPAHAQ